MHQIMMIITLFAGIFVLALLDKKYQLGLTACAKSESDRGLWGGNSANGTCDKRKDERIRQLEQRIEVLERIVTDPQEQLKRDIDKL